MIGIVATESIVKIKRTVVQNAVRPIETRVGCVFSCVCSGVINFDLNNIIHFWEHRRRRSVVFFWIKNTILLNFEIQQILRDATLSLDRGCLYATFS